MSDPDPAAVEKKAKDYYDSGDADNFYFNVWGGEDLHIGIYEREDEPIFDASRRTVDRMAAKVAHRFPEGKVLDIGAGYGGSARHIARKWGVHVVCLNLSVVQNNRNRDMNKEQGLDHLIEVVDGTFEDLPFGDDLFDVIWSQDAILHSGDRKKVFAEVDRVSRPGAEMVFTDPMQKENVDKDLLQPVLDRIHLASLGSIALYTQFAEAFGWKVVEIDKLSETLPRHYARVREELERRDAELAELCSKEYRERMKEGLGHWVNAGNQGVLDWGIMHFRKD